MKPRRKNKRAVNKKPAFLAAFAACGSITEASLAVKIDRGLHYKWLKEDPKYSPLYQAALEMAAGMLKDSAVDWAIKGIFEPLVYQGGFCYAQRERILCTLPDGREVFEEDLPQPIGDVRVQSRRTIIESYGPPLGIHRRSEGLLGKLLAAWAPEFGPRVQIEGEIAITEPDDAKRELLRLLAGIAADQAARSGDRKPE
ncbi:MAG TPA: hypothetical protein VHY84_27325 [Bryobacteraceae bacterium]|jgi:hypothetical protein|nr:hypothetical protein [Bryobacteraceae bacterium]